MERSYFLNEFLLRYIKANCINILLKSLGLAKFMYSARLAEFSTVFQLLLGYPCSWLLYAIPAPTTPLQHSSYSSLLAIIHFMCHWGLDDSEGTLFHACLHSVGIICDDSYATGCTVSKFCEIPRLTHIFTFPVFVTVFPIHNFWFLTLFCSY